MQTAMKFGGMAGFLAALVEWVAYLLATSLKATSVTVVNTLALVCVVLLFAVAGMASGKGHRPVVFGGYAGGVAGFLYGALTAILPAVEGRGNVQEHVVSYVVLVLDAVVFGIVFGWIGAWLISLRERRRGG